MTEVTESAVAERPESKLDQNGPGTQESIEKAGVRKYSKVQAALANKVINKNTPLTKSVGTINKLKMTTPDRLDFLMHQHLKCERSQNHHGNLITN